MHYYVIKQDAFMFRRLSYTIKFNMASVGHLAKLGLRRGPISRSILRAYSSTIPANDPQPSKEVQNVSDTNTLPTSSTGNLDAALQESPEEAERLRVMQAPNRSRPWSRNQRPRIQAMVGPRFEQTIMEYQVGSYCTLLRRYLRQAL